MTTQKVKNWKKGKYRKRHGQLKISSVAGAILSAIANNAKFFYDLAHELDDSELAKIFARPTWYSEMRGKKYYSRSQLTGGLSNLKRGGYAKFEGKRTVFLTEKGIREILKFKMKNKHREKPWDQKWRIIVFDIEEITRKDRDYLRRQLKWIGFEELQKSVWIFPYEIRKELKEFIKLCKFEFQGDIRFIVAETIEPDSELRTKFNLASPK